jgi:hypothetical protein
MKIFLFALLLQFLRGAQNDIINKIMHCEYRWLGFKNSIRFRNFVASFFDNTDGKPLPVEFKGRLLTLYHNFDNADFLKIYFGLQEEDADVREFLNLLEEYYRHFYRKINSYLNFENASEGNSEEFIEGPNKAETVKKIIASLVLMKKKLADKWSEIGNEAFNPLPIIDKIINNILAYDKLSLSDANSFHKLDHDFCLEFSNLELTEYGNKKTLLAQMYKFMESPRFHTSFYRKRIWGAYRIMLKNYENSTLELIDCIRSKLISIMNKFVEYQENPDALRKLKEKRVHYIKVFRYYSNILSPDLSGTNYANTLCRNLEPHCRRSRFSDYCFSTFFEICNGVNPEQIKSLFEETLF